MWDVRVQEMFIYVTQNLYFETCHSYNGKLFLIFIFENSFLTWYTGTSIKYVGLRLV